MEDGRQSHLELRNVDPENSELISVIPGSSFNARKDNARIDHQGSSNAAEYEAASSEASSFMPLTAAPVTKKHLVDRSRSSTSFEQQTDNSYETHISQQVLENGVAKADNLRSNAAMHSTNSPELTKPDILRQSQSTSSLGNSGLAAPNAVRLLASAPSSPTLSSQVASDQIRVILHRPQAHSADSLQQYHESATDSADRARNQSAPALVSSQRTGSRTTIITTGNARLDRLAVPRVATVTGEETPGPGAYEPKRFVGLDGQKYSMLGRGKSKEERRRTGANLGLASPGPAAYSVTRAFEPHFTAGRMSDRALPAFSFSHDAKYRSRGGRASAVPGPGAHNIKPTVGLDTDPRFSRAQLIRFGTEVQRPRADSTPDKLVYVSEEYSKLLNAGMHSPGPASYDIPPVIGTEGPRHVFGTEARKNMGLAIVDKSRTPGAGTYNLKSTIGLNTDPRYPSPQNTRIGTAEQRSRPHINYKKVPVVTGLERSLLGVHSPGPKYEIDDFNHTAPTEPKNPIFSFPHQRRFTKVAPQLRDPSLEPPLELATLAGII